MSTRLGLFIQSILRMTGLKHTTSEIVMPSPQLKTPTPPVAPDEFTLRAYAALELIAKANLPIRPLDEVVEESHRRLQARK